MFRWLVVLVVLLFNLPAQAFDLPGLSRDAGQYREQLERRFPAGATPAQRQGAEQRASAAERANNWPQAAQAWEERAGMGEATPTQWLALARAQLRRAPPEPARALHAAWQNFMMVPAGPPEIPALLLVAEALGRMDRPVQQIAALEAVLQRAPNDARHTEALAQARRAAGLLVSRVNTESEAEPPRACLSFTLPPARRGDWQPQDWIRAEPSIQGLTITRDGDSLCAVGLPHGRTTRLLLRQGLPGEDGLRLNRDTALNIAMPDRAPRMAFDNRAFLLPRGQQARVPLALMNIAAVQMRVIRVAERNLVPLTRDWRLGDQLDSWTAQDLHESWGRVVWEGRIELPRHPTNSLQRVSVPVPEQVRAAGPGLYVMVARPGDGTSESQNMATAQPLIITDLGLARGGRAGRAGPAVGRCAPGRRRPHRADGAQQ